MLEIGKTIVSFDLFEEQFLCDILKCKGACCVEGDSGAPLTEEEALLLEEIYPQVEVYLPERGKAEIKNQGTSVIDQDGDLVTPLIENRECAYSFKDERGILKCGIERAYLEGKVNFRKPVSCHLFPVRITEYEEFDAVNYQQLKICADARECGKSQKVPLYKFLKEPLIRKYGSDWYQQLEYCADQRPWEQKTE